MALPERMNPRDLLDSLRAIDREKQRAASGLDPKTYKRFCERLDVSRRQLLEGLKMTQVPDFPNAWSLNELNEPIFAGQQGALQSQVPGVDPEIMRELKEYFAAFQDDREFDIDLPLHQQFVDTREWDKFGIRQLEEAKPRHEADDFEFADWAYSGVLSRTMAGVKPAAADHSAPKAWKRLIEIAEQPSTPPVDAVKAMDDFLSSAMQQAGAQTRQAGAPTSQSKTPQAAAADWASWVQSVATSGVYSAESIDASMQIAQDIAKHLTRDAAASPPGKLVESWSQWLRASMDQMRPPAPPTDKDKGADPPAR